jgi:ERCC4-related helicase
VHVVGLSELVRGQEAIFLTDLDRVTELAPEATELTTDDSPQYRRTRLYLEALLRRTPPPAGDDRIFLGHKAAIRRAPYQLFPAAKALRQPRPRLLIADGVGLGKTIEVGVLLTELIERGRGDRILVVALKSILAQFQQELWARFTIPLVRLDSVGIQRVQAKVPSSMNPFHHFDRVIISIDTLKKDAKYRRYLEQCRWDAIVIDECQNVADRSGTQHGSASTAQRAQLAKLLARTTDALILTSATPHDGKAASFASVVQLLEPTAIADRESYTKADIEPFFVRRFKKDIAHEVGDAFQERILDPQHAAASAAEDAVFAVLSGIEFRTIAAQRNSRGVLFRTLLLKAFLSSPAACLATIDERLQTLQRLATARDADTTAIAADETTLRNLRQLVAAVAPTDFAKYQRLLDHLCRLGFGSQKHPQARVVLFSERIDTLRFLQQRLTEDLGLPPDASALFYGSLDDQQQREIVQGFGTKSSPLRLLLASDAAAEGLNLHYFCHHLVHFDLPWSLITLEQRNGRVDRYGQEHQPVLTYLLTRPGDAKLRGDLRILDLLIEKEQAAHHNLGDAAWLLRLHDAEREEDHIARGLEQDADPEQVLAARPADGDFLALLLGSTSGEGSAVTTSDPTLYPDDLAYCRDAFAALGRDDARPHFLDHLQGFELHPPPGLRHRLSYLPPELLQQKAGKDPVLKLTTDRKLVMEALEQARQNEGDWPEWQLLWEQHPVCEWLDDTLVATFDRHEAPVLQLGKGIGADETVFLLQGQLTNRRGQPVIVEWFGVACDGDVPRRIRPLATLLTDTGLDRPTANPGRPLRDAERQHLRALLPAAIDRARAHMREVQLRRAQQLAAPLQDSLRRLQAWHDQRLAQIAAQRAGYVQQGRAVPAPTQKRLQQEEHEVQAVRKERHQWLDDGVQTNPDPYLRVVAVLVA